MSRRRGSALFAGLFGVTVLSGCAGLGVPAPATTSAGSAAPTAESPVTQSSSPATPGSESSPTDAAPPTPSSSGATGSEVPDTVARMTGGNGSALPLLVPTSALPSGWTATQARDTRGYRMTVCGVDLEPHEPVDGAQQNWQKGAAGPYLQQNVRVYPDATATTVVADLAEKVPGCRTYTAKDTKGQSTFTVEKLTLKGAPAGTVAWRQRVDVVVPGAATAAPSGTGTGTSTGAPATPPPAQTVEVVQDIAVRRVGAAVVLMNAYAVDGPPDDGVLVTALTKAG
ncbi:hypothetical protein [Mobilicoccus massiliensis]|uniref:hypothetical protein n=1 Tax=Mobilicoccus massiliensis TaxID=1522310 RepID=UPI00058DD3C8|nr:hypothetical protein [Mobilicoccus massiliensis]